MIQDNPDATPTPAATPATAITPATTLEIVPVTGTGTGTGRNKRQPYGKRGRPIRRKTGTVPVNCASSVVTYESEATYLGRANTLQGKRIGLLEDMTRLSISALVSLDIAQLTPGQKLMLCGITADKLRDFLQQKSQQQVRVNIDLNGIVAAQARLAEIDKRLAELDAKRKRKSSLPLNAAESPQKQ